MATKFCGYMGCILDIDLGSETITEYPWSDRDREEYLGGSIMAMKILSEDRAGSPFMISTGPLTGTGAPSSLRYEISGCSPWDGRPASTNCGGKFGLLLKKAGYDAVLIRGRAKNPVYLEINEQGVHFCPADELWGLGTVQCREKLGKMLPDGEFSALRIGQAGENKVPFASIAGEERASGRSGLGAVMGEKRLKAITVSGNRKVPIHDAEASKLLLKEWFAHLHRHPVTGGLSKNNCLMCPINCGKKAKSFELSGACLTGEERQGLACALDDLGMDAMTVADILGDESIADAAGAMEKIKRLAVFGGVPPQRQSSGVHRRDRGCVKLAELFCVEDIGAFAGEYRCLCRAVSAAGLCLFSVNGMTYEEGHPALHHTEMLKYAVGMEMDIERFIAIGRRGLKYEQKRSGS